MLQFTRLNTDALWDMFKIYGEDQRQLNGFFDRVRVGRKFQLLDNTLNIDGIN